MREIIEKLEAADKGSAELDCAIHAALNPLYKQNSIYPMLFQHGGSGKDVHQVPHYTRSVHDALSLVPEGGEDTGDGWRIGFERGPGRGTYWKAWMRRHASDHTIEATAILDGGPALALATVALKARSSIVL